jgi:paraquat-inducible protein A
VPPPDPTLPLILCHDCDLLQSRAPLPDNTRAACRRCGAVLYAEKGATIQRTLALYLAALALFLVANAYPFLTLSMQGLSQSGHLLSSPIALWHAGMPEVAAVIACFVVIAPAVRIAAGLSVLAPLAVGIRPPWIVSAMHIMQAMKEWAMPEVYVLGVLVSYVKLAGLATAHFDVSFYAFVGMTVLLTWAQAAFEPHVVWDTVMPMPARPAPSHDERRRLVGCHACGLVAELDEGHRHDNRCRRCAAALHRRKSDSLNRAAALALAAAVFYVPANALPVMKIVFLGSGEADTILSGVIYLIEANDWPLALLIFFASVTVPLAKLLCLAFLIISVKRRSRYRPRQRTKLFRFVEGVGRWSMIDVFVVGLLTSLVQFGSLSSIEPKNGAIYFCAVVVATIFAAIAFDPRLIWDAAGENHDR